MTTIDDFVYLMVDPSFFDIEIYSAESADTIFTGKADEIPDEYLDLEISSIDAPVNNSICINVD